MGVDFPLVRSRRGRAPRSHRSGSGCWSNGKPPISARSLLQAALAASAVALILAADNYSTSWSPCPRSADAPRPWV